jgi:hypothetical protein
LQPQWGQRTISRHSGEKERFTLFRKWFSDPGPFTAVFLTALLLVLLWTIESLVVIDKETLIVLNDNNYPFGQGRHVEEGEPDDSEALRPTGGSRSRTLLQEL